MRNKVFILWGAALCLLLPGCKKSAAPEPTAVVAPADEWVQGIGYVEPAGEVRRLAFKRPGVIVECRVDIGQQVKKGEVLMRLADAEERAAVVVAESMVALAKAALAQTLAGVNPAQMRAQKAALEAAKVEAAYAKKEFERRQNMMLTLGATSQTDRDQMEMLMNQKAALERQAQAELERLETFVRNEDRAVMEAKVKQAEAQLAEASTALAEMELRAPFDGTVLEVLQREGNPAHSAIPEPVIVFADLTKLRARAEIDETYALRLKQGQAALLHARDEGRMEVTGTVHFVKQVMGKKTVFAKTATERKDLDVLQVLIDLPFAPNLPIGLELDVRINTGARTAVQGR